ncbi:MAG: GntR family transcriptional regulator [Firmicutes bacterium]|nr:GntR family transcriptional regulator [Bacillota bacterium]
MQHVNRDNPIPLYVQIKDFWKRRIESGELQPGDQLPAEQDLCEQHGVSRITVKQAINALASEGLVIRHQGRGTFVASRKFQQDLLRLTSFTEDMSQRGLMAGARLLSKQIVPATSELVKNLGVLEGGKLLCIERVRLANNEPLALETVYFPYDLCPGLLDEDLQSQSVYNLLEQKYGLTLYRAEQFLEPGLATAREARLLQISKGDAVLLIERVTYLKDGRRVEFAKSVYRGDKYRFHVMLERPTLNPSR